MPVRTTTVGSWWTPEEHADDLRRYHRGELGADEGTDVVERAARAAIGEQRELGLDEWTGGEYFTDNFIDHMQREVSGWTVVRPDAPDVFDYDDLALCRIDGELTAPNGLGYVRAYERERLLPGGVPKATVVGPIEVTIHAIDQPDEVQRQMPNLLGIINREIRGLAAAGCPHVQLDVPTIGQAVTSGQMTPDDAAGVIAACFDGVDGVRRGIHICNGNLMGRPLSATLRNAPWIPILERLEGVIDVANLECSYFSEYLEREAFTALPASMELAAGIVDEASYAIESARKIRERAADWARVVGEERLWVSPSCGFGRHPARDVPVLRAKVEHMVEAAQTL
jgi:methionine synthase II (cobalamin-independent)